MEKQTETGWYKEQADPLCRSQMEKQDIVAAHHFIEETQRSVKYQEAGDYNSAFDVSEHITVKYCQNNILTGFKQLHRINGVGTGQLFNHAACRRSDTDN